MSTPKTKKLKGVTIEKPFVYGTVSMWQGKNAEEQKSFLWTAYVRGVDHEDLGHYIKRVTIHLHSSFANPVRALDQAPFEVTESGWGEFALIFTVQFHDPTLKPVELHHFLKLFPEGGQQNLKENSPVISEHYDEFIFVEPSEEFHSMLVNNPRPPINHRYKSLWSRDKLLAEEHMQMKTLMHTEAHVLQQMAKAKAEMLAIEAEMQSYREQLALLSRSQKK